MNNDWITQLKNLADGHQQTPPEGLLDDVRQQMASRKLMPASSAATPRLTLLRRRWWMGAAAAGLLLAGIGLTRYLHTDRPAQPGTQPLAAAPTAVASPARPTGHPATPNAGRPTSPLAATTQPATAYAPMANTDTPTASAPALAATPSVRTTSDPDQPLPGTPSGTPATEQPTAAASQPHRPTTDARTPDWPTADTYQSAARNRHALELAAYLGPQSSPSALTNQPDAMLASNTYGMDRNPTMLNTTVLFAKAALPPVIREHHDRPVRIGLSVGYRLTSRWRLLTGLTYTRLHSEFSEESSSYMRSTDQTLHYVGIPVSAAYDLWHTRHLRLYAKAGVEIEKLVSGKAIVQQTYSLPLPRTTEKLTQHSPLFSTCAAAGVEYQPVKRVSIFAEPGTTYHFSNGSDLRSAYTAHPLDFSLSIGLRIRVK